MQSLADVSLADFEAVLTPAEVRTSVIIQAAIGVGLMLFIGVVFLMYSLIESPADGPPPDTHLVTIMSLVHLGLAVVLFIAAKVVCDMQFRPERLRQILAQGGFPGAEGKLSHLEPPQLCLWVIRSAMIIRLAMYEGIALFGLVACLLGVVENVVQIYPVYWLNLLSSLLMIGYVVATLPNRARIKAVFKEKIQQLPAS